MKQVLTLLTMLSISSAALAELESADKETLVDIYEYCVSMQDADAVNDKQLLVCINEELEYGDYKQFKSLEEVKAAIK